MEAADLTAVADAVRAAAARREACDAVAEVYAAVEREVGARRPRCDLSGRCCRFEEFGHRLYVTTLELGAFVRDLASSPAPAKSWDGTGCPFQIGKLCGVHPIRPFGCRMYFCDPTAAEWQNQLYERYHAELKRLHESFGVPYFYVEWRAALQSLGLPAGGAGAADGRRDSKILLTPSRRPW